LFCSFQPGHHLVYPAPAHPSSPTVPFSEPPDPIVFQFQAIALTFPFGSPPCSYPLDEDNSESNYEIPDTLMEDSILVISPLTQFNKIVNCLWRRVGVEFHIDIPIICLDAGVTFDFDPL
jgi:hypothetical protein